MGQHIRIDDVHVMDAEPRVMDLTLAGALAFAQPRDIRKLIQRNLDELAQHGEVCATVAQTSDQGGRPGTEYWLNEGQALVITMFSRTAKAADVRKEIIDVFMAWRRGRTLPPPAPEVFATVAKTSPFCGAAPQTSPDEPIAVQQWKLSVVREARILHGMAAARRIWAQQGLPDPGAGSAVGPTDLDAQGCLDHLLAHTIRGETLGEHPGENEAYELTLRQAITRAIDGDEDMRLDLTCSGIRIEEIDGEDRFWVASYGDALQRRFAGTRWSNGWRHALKRLPGAIFTKVYKVNGIPSRGFSLPAGYLDDVALAS